MKVLITGGAGFVGSNLARAMAERGDFALSVLDNESMGSREALDDLPVNFIAGDVRDKETLRGALSGIDAVIHLAADTRVMDSIANPDFNFDNNVVATYNLLQVAREQKVKQILSASTGGAILGEARAPVHEDMVARPLSPYGASKLACEGYLNAFAGSYGMKAASLRFSNIFGPGSYHKGSVVAHFLKKILNGESLTVYGDGSQVRDYLFVGDLVNGIVAALNHGVTGVYQLGSGKGTSINELLGIIEETIPDRSWEVIYEDFRPGEIHTTWCNIRKAQDTFGFKPDTPVSKGISETWEWFCAQREI